MGMTTIDTMQTEQSTLMKLGRFHQLYKNNDDPIRAGKVKELIRKIVEKERVVAFCGHFSAGKSTMINTLIGENLLATSPIPTSANLVKIKVSQDHLVKVHFQDGTVKKYLSPFQLDEIKRMTKDGENIQKIEIELPSTNLPLGSIILDTPGIDSTDDAHRLATESAMHLADAVFYCVDYNHVQAEENFLFTKEMANFGKDVYLIVNMIDKHQEKELSMEQFKQFVKTSFAAWSIEPTKIFYTSLKDFTHPHNQFNDLVDEINEIFSKEQQIDVTPSLKLLMDEHLQKYLDEQAEIRANAEQTLERLSETEQQQITKDYKEVTNQLNKLVEVQENLADQYNQELDSILKNAYLMPATTRELAKEYLLSIQKDFKVGFLFTKKKTEEKKQEILKNFLEAVQENTNTQITWHLKQMFANLVKKYRSLNHELEIDIQKLTIPVTTELIQGTVKQGALVTGESVLLFTNDVAEKIKRETRSRTNEIFMKLKQSVKKNNDKEYEQLQSKRIELEKFIQAQQELAQLDHKYSDLKNQLQSIYQASEHQLDQNMISYSLSLLQEKQQEAIIEEMKSKKNEEQLADRKIEKNVQKVPQKNIEQIANEQQAMITKLRESAKVIKDIPMVGKLADQLIERARRLEEQRFTVALFGAFSAGKSSFANALIGDKLLPVSPNPTTATINRILPADENHPHETGLVRLKTAETLLADLNEALQHFHVPVKNLEEANQVIKDLDPTTIDQEKYHTHLSFLYAFAQGYSRFKEKLGQVVKVSKKEFQQFVAEEDKSCFVEAIDFYVHSKVTDQGIVFVDTPGADSINARHTDVAFEYIKNADAIIFVTYYNHAFSKADREFLIQLGRVKDQFALDKMFFIVNAIDLANNEEELTQVLDYLSDQLLQFGIRNANLFPVSSLHALKEKQTGEELGSRFNDFEDAFYHFITGDLRKIALSTSEMEWTHARERIQHLVESAAKDRSEKAAQRKQLERERGKINDILATNALPVLNERLRQEIHELIYYIEQRVGYRFNDFFTESFNPATIKGSGSESKQALHEACNELIRLIGFDLAQELRATSLRIENYLNKLLIESRSSLVEEMKKINSKLAFSTFEAVKIDTPGFETGLKELTSNEFTKELSLFKGTRAFFEKNEKKIMAEKIQNKLKDPIASFLQQGEKRLQKQYIDVLNIEFERLLSEIRIELDEQYASWFSVLDEKIDINLLQERLTQLQKLNSIQI